MKPMLEGAIMFTIVSTVPIINFMNLCIKDQDLWQKFQHR